MRELRPRMVRLLAKVDAAPALLLSSPVRTVHGHQMRFFKTLCHSLLQNPSTAGAQDFKALVT